MSRGIILTKSGNFYITSDRPDKSQCGMFLVGDLATRGQVSVPINNIEAVEFYDEYEIETFRLRHTELKAKVAT